MPLNAIPLMLTKRALVPAVRLYDAEAFNEFPLQQIFGESPTIVSAKKFRYMIRTHLRQLANYHAAPPHAEESPLVEDAEKRGSVLHLAEKYVLDADDLAAFAMLDAPREEMPFAVVDLMAAKRTAFDAGMRAIVRKFRRTKERVCAQILSSGSFSLTVSQFSETVNYGIVVENIGSVAWTNPAADIIGDFLTKLHEFIEAAGGPPTKIGINHMFWPTYIKPNNDFREFDIRNTLLGHSALFRQATGLNDLESPPMWINSSDQYDTDGAGTLGPIFPVNRMVFVREEPGSFGTVSARTFDNDLQGGLFAREVMTQEAPITAAVEVTDNHIPVPYDITKVKIYDLDAAQ